MKRPLALSAPRFPASPRAGRPAPMRRVLPLLVAGALGVVLGTGCARTAAGRDAQAPVMQPQSAEEVRQIVRDARRPVLIAFTSESCATCRTMLPALDGLARDYAGRLIVVHADLARTGALVAEYNLIKVPTVVVVRDGREVARRHGLLPSPLMRPFIEEALRNRPR